MENRNAYTDSEKVVLEVCKEQLKMSYEQMKIIDESNKKLFLINIALLILLFVFIVSYFWSSYTPANINNNNTNAIGGDVHVE